ncbi:MAG: hypothetical protein OJF49_002971 [Ktedonobacterales bacterium]|nr:MAG: hypothetical protein OJF49_002971 [Ktedonobacterales bacterium]
MQGSLNALFASIAYTPTPVCDVAMKLRRDWGLALFLLAAGDVETVEYSL